ncbi:MAG TPA: EAL domain-containing protein [Steroidobacteraceae bacterium]|jgi:diguanylate cyclase (GGDEF)-like protein|nr:EAL domain-containing protein [Steroidobacteraceae bacterium]
MKPAQLVSEASLGTKMILAVALSYLIDGMLLTGFAMSGTISATVPMAYTAIGLFDSAIFLLIRAWSVKHRRDNSEFALAQVIGSSTIQLLFAALVPQMAFYFFTVLFIVFGCASLGLSKKQSAIAWMGVAVAAAVVMSSINARILIPQGTALVRGLVWLCFVATLGRCILLGVFGRALRLRLHDRRQQLRDSIHLLKERDKSLANANLELKRQATHDALTGIANRVLFVERLNHAVYDREPFAVCVLDLDRFKIINDSLGHGAGDALLKHVTERLLSIVRSSDMVARAGGDEFLLLLRNLSAVEEIEGLIARWMSALSQPYQITGLELHVSASIGMARFPIDGTGAEELLARADEAMYFAKRSGRKTFRFFDASVMGFSRERLEIEAELRGALAQRQLALHYQPKIDIATGEMRSVEALIRWHHPNRGFILPGEFIPIAEESGLILEIGDWVIREACRQARVWQQRGLPFLRVAVNVSPLQFRQANFVKKVHAALKEHSLDATYLEIELTEATLMSNAETSVALLEQLSELGVVVAIDDFGTGYSSMSYLQRFPIDKLKIDRSFISDVASNADDASIVRAIISLAHGLRLKVIAEGVESEEQLGILRRMGCDQYQGFFRSAAVPAADIEKFVRDDTERLKQQGETDIDRTQSKLFRLREA